MRRLREARKAGQRINYGVSVGTSRSAWRVFDDRDASCRWRRVRTRRVAGARSGDRAAHRARISTKAPVSIGAGFRSPGATRRAAGRLPGCGTNVHAGAHHIRPGVGGLKVSHRSCARRRCIVRRPHQQRGQQKQTPEMLRLIGAARRRGRDVTTSVSLRRRHDHRSSPPRSRIRYAHERADRVSEIEWPLTGERLSTPPASNGTRRSVARSSFTRTPKRWSTLAIGDPLTMIGSDATGRTVPDIRHRHLLARAGTCVRETHVLTLMDAIRKMTLMPAQRLSSRASPAMKRARGALPSAPDADLTVLRSRRASWTNRRAVSRLSRPRGIE